MPIMLERTGLSMVSAHSPRATNQVGSMASSRTPESQVSLSALTAALRAERASAQSTADERNGRPMKVKGLAVNLGTYFGHRIGRG
jgi:hypothetical protein